MKKGNKSTSHELQESNKQRPLTFKEATKYLDISSSYLYKLTSTTKITHYKPNGKKIYFKESDLKKWLLRGKVLSESELEQKAIDYVHLGNS